MTDQAILTLLSRLEAVCHEADESRDQDYAYQLGRVIGAALATGQQIRLTLNARVEECDCV